MESTSGGISLNLSVQSVDLATGTIAPIFKAPGGGWIDSASASPDGQELIISYQPSGDSGQAGLYILPLDGSKPPQLLFPQLSTDDRYYQALWSVDGKYIYFSHANYQNSTSYEIMRMKYPDGTPEKLVEQAYWPNISEDGSHLIYVLVDPATGANGLFIANADGTQPRQIPLSGLGARQIIDAPIIAPDNQSIVFSAPAPVQSIQPNWVDNLFGITVAYAHSSVPSEWWSVPLKGGKPIQLTHIHLYGLFGNFSPDHQYMASFSTDGIFVMKPDGTSLTKVVDYVGGVLGTVDWTP
ncbi:MAG TPA: hypothetical protein VHM28_02920 [Anaerolineales bacterium]|nr:hypothetical protein [Anaerolineales bacterium]